MPDGLLTIRRPVQPGDCDVLGHMNVARYVDAVSDAMFTMQGAVGLTRDGMAASNLSFVAVRLEADYRAELCAGDVVTLYSEVLQVGTKSARFGHRMYDDATGRLVFEAENVSVLFNLTLRNAVAIPDDMRAALTAMIAEKGGSDAA